MTFDYTLNSLTDEQLLHRLRYLPCFAKHTVNNISVIEAGLSQASFHVECEGKSYFAKYLVDNSIEPQVSQLAAAHGFSPKVFYAEQPWLITEFIAGQGLEKSKQLEDEKLLITMSLLIQCHAISICDEDIKGQTVSLAIPTLDIPTIISQLLQQLQLSKAQVQALKSLIYLFQQNLIKAHSNVDNTKLVLCHGDANFSNVITTNISHLTGADKGIKIGYQLVDFECARIAPPEYDLAMLMAVNDIDFSKAAMINTLYQQMNKSLNKTANIVDNVNEHTNKTFETTNNPLFLVTCYYDFSFLINALWYFERYQRQQLVKYKILAIKQLMSLAIRHPQANIVLDEMR
ncbi:MAG: thiamine kinase-like enzyme [Psychroserpens sp.]